MKRVPKFYYSEEETVELKLSTRCDKFGNIFYCVQYPDDHFECGFDYAIFEHLSSALDFINSNFK